jgi:hypothetical protein
MTEGLEAYQAVLYTYSYFEKSPAIEQAPLVRPTRSCVRRPPIDDDTPR